MKCNNNKGIILLDTHMNTIIKIKLNKNADSVEGKNKEISDEINQKYIKY